jgi:uncharacterized membrane protein
MHADKIAELARQLLELDEGDLSQKEKRVIERTARRLAVTRDVNADYDREATVGERLADRVARVGGSWGFIIGFGVVMFVWMVSNAILLGMDAFDPYPFIFLNLMLSLLAAVQAPVILMSQNREASRDRLAAKNDYEVNLKAEIEIAALHEKLDQIRAHELAILVAALEGRLGAKG